MAIYPGAVWRPMPWQASLPARVDVAQAIIHTNGGGTDKGSLYGFFSRKANTQHIASHYQVMFSGVAEQYEDTSRQAFAQYSGNKTGISLECEDDGNPATPLTAEQISTIVAILKFHRVPPQIAQPTGPGVGWHSLYQQWNLSGHGCPGSVRVAQIRNLIIPALAPPLHPNVPPVQEEDLMLVLTDSQGGRGIRADGSGYYKIGSAEWTALNHLVAQGAPVKIIRADNKSYLDADHTALFAIAK